MQQAINKKVTRSLTNSTRAAVIGAIGLALGVLAVVPGNVAAGPGPKPSSPVGGSMQGSAIMARVVVTESGVQRLRYEDLQAAGVDISATRGGRLALLDEGRPVPVWIGGSGVLGPGSWIEFVGKASEDNLYSAENVYELRSDTKGASVSELRRMPRFSGELGLIELADESIASQRVYTETALTGDPWYDQELRAISGPVEAVRTFNVDHLAEGTARLTVELFGVTNWPGGTLDHHVEVLVNGTRVIDEWFDGMYARTLVVDVPSGQLVEGSNAVTVRVPRDTGYSYDIIGLESVSLSYPRYRMARNNVWHGSVAGEGRNGHSAVTVGGLSGTTASAWFIDARGDTVRGEFAIESGAVVLPTTNGKPTEIWLSAADSALTPTIRPGIPSPAERTRVDYLIVTSGALRGRGLAAVEAMQHSRGLSTAVVDVEAIYAAWSDHEVDANAIHSFIKEVQPRFVLLLGADSYDYKGYLGATSFPRVPTNYIALDFTTRMSPSDALYGDLDDDGVADIPVGRLPVTSDAQTQQWVQRVQAGPLAAQAAVFASGKSDFGRAFSAISERLEQAYARPAWQFSSDDLGTPGARAELLSALAMGPGLVSYHGHSKVNAWGFDNLLKASDISGLPGGTRIGLVTTWTSWNHYFVHPTTTSFGETFLLAGDRGAAATFGSATTSTMYAQETVGKALLARVGTPEFPTLGSAVLAATRDAAQSNPSVLGPQALSMILLGDPAMPLDLPVGQPAEDGEDGGSEPPREG